MRTALWVLLTSMTGAWAVSAKELETAKRAAREDHCVECHGDKGLWKGERRRLCVTEEDLAEDIHWQKGLRCHDCHGGDPTSADIAATHAVAAGYRPVKSPADILALCGRCHSDAEYMRRYNPSPRTDQLAQYWTSGHGQRLKQDGEAAVATCVSCHGYHSMRPIDDPESSVHPQRVAETCASCHSRPELAAGREYHGRPLRHNQLDLWMSSVHAEAMLKRGDLMAPTCNDCHGNHGAVAPEIDEVANLCGQCHTKIASLFSQAGMKQQLEEVGLPGCVTCHSDHDIHAASDEMLGIGGKGLCAHCHTDGHLGAPRVGAQVAFVQRSGLDRLKERIAVAETKLSQAERLGLDVRAPRSDLRKATTALTNSRTLMHAFALDPMNESLGEGVQVADQVIEDAENALRYHSARRIYLGVFLFLILAVMVLLFLYIRNRPYSTVTARSTSDR